jgi:hypothetical protein
LKNPPSLLPKSVFIESSINGSSEEMQSYTSSIKQLPEFNKCTYNENGEVIVKLQSVFDGPFTNVQIETISKQAVDAHQKRLISGKQGVHISAGDIKWTLLLATPQRIEPVTSHFKTT